MKKNIAFILITWFAVLGFHSSLAMPLQNPSNSTRQRLDLNGEWQFRQKEQSEWQSIQVPSLLREEGIFFFRRSFELPQEHQDSQFYLVLEGVNFSCRVKLNDQYLANQTHGFTSLSIPIDSDLLRFHRVNQLELEVDTHLSTETMPVDLSLYQPKHLRGIYRDVYLKMLPPIGITSIQNRIQVENNGSAAIIESRLRIEANPSYLRNMIREPVRGDLILSVNATSDRLSSQPLFSREYNVQLSDINKEPILIPILIRQPDFWQISFSNQYNLLFTLKQGNQVIDQFEQKTGIRTVEMQDQHLVLNQKPVTVRGITFIEDPPHWLTRQNILNYLLKIQSLGFNTISWFKPPPEYALAMTDSLGLFSILQLPAWNLPAGLLTQAAVRENSAAILENMLPLAQKHPSVLAVKLGSGLDASENKTYRYINMLLDKSQNRDNILITAGFHNYHSIHSPLALDFITVDLLGKSTADLQIWIDQWISAHNNLPILFGEIAIPFIPTIKGVENNSTFESNQAFQLKRTVQDVLQHPTLGYVLGGLFDWKGVYPTLLSPLLPDKKIFPLGLATNDGTPRMAWNMISNLNSHQPDQFSFQKSRNGSEKFNLFLIVGLIVSALFLYFFQKDHRLRGNFIRILSRPFGFYAELKEGRKIPYSITWIIHVTAVLTWALIISSLFHFFRMNPFFDFLLAMFIPWQNIHLAFIAVSWKPWIGLIGFASLIGISVMLLIVYIRLLSIFSKKIISLRNAFTFVNWECSVFIFLLPLALILYRILSIEALQLPLFILLILFLLWFFYRLYKGANIIFSFPRWLSFSFIFVVPALILLVIIIYYNQSQSLFAYSEYIIHIWKSGF